MNEFDFDAMQKKRIAQGARHKKNGSKSHGCTLPSDLLTEAQRRKLNGPVITLKLDEPMPWKDFKALPEDKRRLYAEHIKGLYNPSWKQWGQLFHAHPNAVRQHFIRYTITDARGNGANTTSAERARWDAFCNGVVGGKPGTPANTATKTANDTVEPVHDTVETPVCAATDRTNLDAYHKARDEATNQMIAKMIIDHAPKQTKSAETRAATIEHFEIGIRAERWEDVFELVGRMPMPEVATIRVWRLQGERPTCDGPVTENALPTVSAPATGV